MAKTVTRVTLAGTKQRVTQARLSLQREIRIVKDLLFLRAHVRLSPKQEHTIDEAIRKASDVTTLYSEQYIRAVNELVALNTK